MVDENDQEDHDLFLTIMGVGHIPMFFVSPDLFIKKVSPYIATLVGVPQSEINDQYYPQFCQIYHLRDIISPHLGTLVAHPEKIIEAPEVLFLEGKYSLHIHWRIFSVLDRAKKPRGYAVLGKDVTDVNEQRLYLENVVSCLPGSIYWKDKQGIYLGCNDVVVRMAGANSSADIIGKTDFDLCWKDTAEQVAKDEQEIMESGIAKDLEITGTVSGGITTTFLTTKTPLRNYEGKVIGIVANSLDITQRKKMEKELKLAKEDAEKANKVKSEFIENMSHDIKTPISSIVSMAELLTLKLKENIYKRHAEEIKKSAHQLLDLFSEVLDVMNKEAVDKPENVVFDLKKLAQEVIDFLNPTIREKKIQFKFDYPKKINNACFGNRFHLYRVILNLISNAVKFTKQGGKVSLSLKRLKADKESQQIEIAVNDTGIGIPKESQEIIFEQYTRLMPAYTGQYKGSGLGLYIVKKMVEEMKGVVSVESEVNKGSTFRVVLTLALSKEKIREEPKKSLSLSSLPRQQKKIPVLLVEDNPVAQRVVRELLISVGCKVEVAGTGQEGFEKFIRGNYALLCMDVGLPDISGYEVTEKIRQYEKETNQSSAPIVGLTAHVQKQDLDKGVHAGMNQVFSKPLTLQLAQEILAPLRLGQAFETSSIGTRKTKEKLPVIDLKIGVQILGGDKNAARNMVEELVKMLPGDLVKLKTAFEMNDYLKLKQIAHYIKGSASYCGTPRLEKAAAALNHSIKEGAKKAAIRAAYKKLCDEIKAVLRAFPKL